MKKPLLAAALAVLISGCGSGSTNVSGKVKYQGKPVVFGSVVIVGSDGLPRSGAIQPDGSFRVNGVSPGAAKVAVSSPPPPGAATRRTVKRGRDEEDRGGSADVDVPASPEVIKGWFPLAEKFGDPTSSMLTAEIKPGSPVDLDLK